MKCVVECAPDYSEFFDSTINQQYCIKCTNPRCQCTITDFTDCTKCIDSSWIHITNPSPPDCYPNCLAVPGGTTRHFYNADAHMCQLCATGCTTCFGPTLNECTAC